MGAQNTKTPASVGHLSSEEVTHFKSLLNTISTNLDKVPVCTAGDFQKHCEKYLDDWLSLKLSEKFSMKNPKGGEKIISAHGFLEFMSGVFKGTLEEKISCVLEIAGSGAVGTNDALTREEISKYARSIVESYLKSMHVTRQSQSWHGSKKLTSESISDLTDFLLLELNYEGVQPKEIITKEPQKSVFTLDELINSLAKAPLLLNLQSSVFSDCFNFDKSLYTLKLIPQCLHVKREFSPSEFTILDLAQIIFLNSQLPSELRKQWRYLFSTSSDGESFSKMMGGTLDKGSTLIVVKENKGRIFGAFADEGWAMGPKFRGSEKCFFFHLDPKMVTYPSTGFNQNYQYLNLQQQTFPNGLGMGGKLEYFGLWLDAEFGKGKCSPSCTTFVSPQLSVEQEFGIHTLEVWGVGPEPAKEEGLREEKSILDKDPEAQAILELMNKAPVSNGYRDKKKAYEENDDDD